MGNDKSVAADGVTARPDPLLEYRIDTNREYGPEYKEFMDPEGYWDRFGPYSTIFETDSLITFEEVE